MEQDEKIKFVQAFLREMAELMEENEIIGIFTGISPVGLISITGTGLSEEKSIKLVYETLKINKDYYEIVSKAFGMILTDELQEESMEVKDVKKKIVKEHKLTEQQVNEKLINKYGNKNKA